MLGVKNIQDGEIYIGDGDVKPTALKHELNRTELAAKEAVLC
jgi:hypothetical protein